MQGNIADFSVSDILQLISLQRKSGSLGISKGDRAIDFFFSEGRIVDVKPILPEREYRSLLGVMLRDAGYITDGALKYVLEIKEKNEAEKIGEILLEQKMVSREVISKYLGLQIKECLFDVLTYKEGQYRFEGFAVRPLPWGGEPIRLDILMMEGMQLIDEYPMFRQKFPAGDFRVRRKKGEQAAARSLSAQEGALLEALEFSDRLERIFRKACLTGFEGIKGLASLFDRGLLEVERVAAPAVDTTSQTNEKLRFLRLLERVKAVLWLGAGVVILLWVRKLFLSSEVLQFFMSWLRFF